MNFVILMQQKNYAFRNFFFTQLRAPCGGMTILIAGVPAFVHPACMRGFAYKLCRTLFIVATVVFLALAAGSCVMMWREVDPGATDQQTGLLALGWAVGMIPVFFVWMVVAVPLYLLARMFRSGEDLRLVGGNTTERQDPKL